MSRESKRPRLKSKTEGVDPVVDRMVRDRDVKRLSEVFWDIELTGGQVKIVKNIAFDLTQRLVILAYTRYGKTMAVAIGVIFYLLFHENKNVSLLGPTQSQTGKIREYISEFLLKCKPLADLVDTQASGLSRLKKEVSKRRITFKDGSQIRTLTAKGGLMGFGADLLIEDESGLIDYKVYRQKIYRMLGDDPENSIHIEISNPWDRTNQLWENWNDPDYDRIHIGCKQGIEEGRTTKEFIEERREKLADWEFDILYNSKFPNKSENSLIPYSWIERAVNKEFDFSRIEAEDEAERSEEEEKEGFIEVIYGMDVAGEGNDLNVLSRAIKVEMPEDDVYIIDKMWSWSEPDTMATAGKVMRYMGDNKDINVDATGIGKGVADRLRERGYNANLVKVGRSPKDEEEKAEYRDLKAKYYWRLRRLFEERRISIKRNKDLIDQLSAIETKYTSSKRKKIEDPGKSPDFADSLMFAVIKKPEMAFGFV